MKIKNISYQNTIISYKVIGSGQTVVLLHGFAENAEVWHNQIDFLKERFQLIIPDIPGSGLSPFNEKLSSIDDHAEAIKAILDIENIIDCVFIGHSMGGYITLSLAEKYPGLLKAFGLFHSTAFADSEEKKQARLKGIDFIKANGPYAFVNATTPGLFTDDFKTKYPTQVNTLVEEGGNFTSNALIQYSNAMLARPDRVAVLKNFPKPVLFIMGEQDTVIPLQNGLQQCHLPSQSHIHILANSAHMGMWEEAAKANEILFSFLNRVAS